MRKTQQQYIHGTFHEANARFGIVSTSDGTVVRIPHNHRKNAFSGDSVRVYLLSGARSRMKAVEGKIVEVVERASRGLVGVFHRSEKHGNYAEVIGAFGSPRLSISERNRHDAKDRDIVRLSIIDRSERPTARVDRVLGHTGDPRTYEYVTYNEYNIPDDFPEIVHDEAKGLALDMTATAWRLDLKSTAIMTIDGADARDFDDAIHIRDLAGGGWELGVHIADVSHYVREGGAIDREAYARATSMYFPDRVVPMLPPILSDHLASLVPHEPRLTLSAIMRIDPQGNVLSCEIHESIIESVHRFTYDAFEDVHTGARASDGYDSEILATVERAYRLHEVVRARREREGKIDFDIGEMTVQVAADGSVVSVGHRERKTSHRIIEECMILANEEVTKYCRKHTIPILYRVHDRPEETDIHALRAFMAEYGYTLPPGSIGSREIADLARAIRDRGESHFLLRPILSFLTKAEYRDEYGGHFGLGLTDYTHFTSPIRRYPDLLVHRAIKAFLHGTLATSRTKFAKDLKVSGPHTSARERIAETAEREIRHRKILSSMQDKIGMQYTASVAGMTEYGLYVELSNGIEGFVPIRLMDGEYRYDAIRRVLVGISAEGRSYRLGDTLEVRVREVSQALRRLDFEPVREERSVSLGYGGDNIRIERRRWR